MPRERLHGRRRDPVSEELRHEEMAQAVKAIGPDPDSFADAPERLAEAGVAPLLPVLCQSSALARDEPAREDLRDLWERQLPPSMLYQLTVYAAIQGPGGVAAILYPTQSAAAREVRIEVCSPGAVARAVVALRPVHVGRLVAELAGSAAGRRAWVRALAGLLGPVAAAST